MGQRLRLSASERLGAREASRRISLLPSKLTGQLTRVPLRRDPIPSLFTLTPDIESRLERATGPD